MVARADTYTLADNTSVTGDIVTFDDIGIKFRTPDDKYTDRISWTKFSQDSLKKLAKNPRIQPLVEPFIEIPRKPRSPRAEIHIHDVTRLDLPPKQSLIGALFSSSVGLFALLLIYAANIYSGYEIAVVRARPKGLVMGVAAVLPILGPIIFLAMPVQMQSAPAEEMVAEADPAGFAVPGQPVGEVQVTAEAAAGAAPTPAAGQSFKRGQFTFNRRFVETKFSGFFGAIRHGAEKNQIMLLRTGSGQFTVERITRIASSDVHLEVTQGGSVKEIMVPFADIQEIQIKPKNA
jgi:hypothetical protein